MCFEALDTIGLKWIRQNHPEWSDTFQRLLAFQRDHGHVNVLETYNDGLTPHLGLWIRTQRKAYREQRMDADRIDTLEAIGFKWDTKDCHPQWNDTFQRLQLYVQEHGHANVPTRYNDGHKPHLGSWVLEQRKAWRAQTMDSNRFEMLDALGFQWNVKKSAPTWSDTLQRLQVFVQEHGHANVPWNYNDGHKPHLGNWVRHQRRGYRNHTMDSDHVLALEALGFSWYSTGELP